MELGIPPVFAVTLWPRSFSHSTNVFSAPAVPAQCCSACCDEQTHPLMGPEDLQGLPNPALERSMRPSPTPSTALLYASHTPTWGPGHQCLLHFTEET